MSIITTNLLNNVEYDKNIQILVFEYEDKFFKVLPDENIDLVNYAKASLLSGIKYKIFEDYQKLNKLTIEELKNIFNNPDGTV
jgi:hypothetical protein